MSEPGPPDDELDRQLRASRPAAQSRDAGVIGALNALVDEQHDSRARRRRAPFIVGVTFAALLATGATVAAAAPGALSFLGWHTQADNQTRYAADGRSCAQAFRVAPAPPATEDSAAVAEARAFVADLDLDELIVDVEDDSTLQKPDSPRRHNMGLHDAVWAALQAHLEERGLSSTEISLESGGACDEAGR